MTVFCSIPAYGYKKDEHGYLVIDEKEAPIVKRIFQMSLEGVGTYTIANIFNKEGIPTKSVKFKGKIIERKDKYTKRTISYPRDNVGWRGNVIHDIIKNPIHKGERNYGDVSVQIDAIIEPGLWEKVNRNLEQNKKNVGPKTKFKYLLNGLIFCANCDSELRGKFKTSGRNKTYSCKGRAAGKECSSARGLNIPRFESFILNHLFDTEDLYKKLKNLKEPSDKVDVLKKELEDLKKKEKQIQVSIKHLYRLLIDPNLKEDVKDDYLKVKNDLEQINIDIENKREEIAQQSLVQRNARLDRIFGAFNYQMNFDEIKKSVHGIIESIVVNHMPEQKYFVVQINYRGFDKKSVFATTHGQMKWINMRHTQVVPRTEEDKQQDNELLDYLASTENWPKEKLIDALKHFEMWDKEYEGWEVPKLLEKLKEVPNEGYSKVNIETPNVVLKKDELYDFNI